MIPSFNKRGVLPTGLHKCSPNEFIQRFCSVSTEDSSGISPARVAYLPVLNQLFGHSLERGVNSIIFGGSFITNNPCPDDLDCIVILPNYSCKPNTTEIIVLSDCKLDLVYAFEENRSMVYSMMNMFAKDKYDLEVGLVEVLLSEGVETTWDDYLSEYSFSKLLQERETYIHRHCIVGNRPKGLLVTIHGLNTYAEWNHVLAPIASSSNWIFAPFSYGHVTLNALLPSKRQEILDKFREWIFNIQKTYKINPSVFAHSFGTYIFASYLHGFSYTPPVQFADVVFAGSIVNEDLDWITAFEKQTLSSLFNIVAPNDPYVDYMRPLKLLKNDPLYGSCGTQGFNKKHPRLFSETLSIYDHSNMLKTDIFEKRVLPYLTIIKNFERFNYSEYISEDFFKNYLFNI